MKIALFGSKDFDSLEYHLHDSLRFLGHEVFHLDIKNVVSIPYRYNYWARKIFVQYDEFLFKKVAVKLIESDPELVIITYRFTHPSCVKMIKNALPNVKVVHVNPDALTTFEQQQIFASPYDAYFTKDPYIVDFMKNKMALNAHYLPEAFNPRIHKPGITERSVLEQEVAIDVVSFGTIYPYRAKMVSELISRGVNVTLFGTPDRKFPRQEIMKNFRNEFITGERKADVLLGSKIIFNNFHYAEIESANVKFFEIAGIGGFQICDHKQTLDEYSTIDTAKFTYKTINEAYELIQFYLEKPELRYSISEQQRAHFLQNHTYEHRVDELFKKL